MINKIECNNDREIQEFIKSFREYERHLKDSGIKPDVVLLTPEHPLWDTFQKNKWRFAIRRPRIKYKRKKKPLIRFLRKLR